MCTMGIIGGSEEKECKGGSVLEQIPRGVSMQGGFHLFLALGIIHVSIHSHLSPFLPTSPSPHSLVCLSVPQVLLLPGLTPLSLQG